MLTVPHARHLYDEGFAGKLVYATVFVESMNGRLTFTAYNRFDVAPRVEIVSANPKPFVVRRGGAETNGRETALTLDLQNHANTGFNGRMEIKTNDGTENLPITLP